MSCFQGMSDILEVEDVKPELVSVKSEPGESQDVDMEGTGDLTQREACFLLFSKFSKEVRNKDLQFLTFLIIKN